MARVHTSVVGHEHEYTRSDSPWVITEGKSAYAKMINYISGGGMRTFGRTVRQEENLRKRLRFLVASGVIAAVWAVFWVF